MVIAHRLSCARILETRHGWPSAAPCVQLKLQFRRSTTSASLETAVPRPWLHAFLSASHMKSLLRRRTSITVGIARARWLRSESDRHSGSGTSSAGVPRRVKRFLQVAADGAVGGLSVAGTGYSASAVLLIYVRLERHELGGTHGSLQGHARAAIYQTRCMHAVTPPFTVRKRAHTYSYTTHIYMESG